MPIEFEIKRINFTHTTGSEQNVEGSVTFTTPVRTAKAVINGFRAAYTGSDHELKELKINIDNFPKIDDREVSFNVNYLLRDNSGNINDAYDGFVDVVVIADVI